jgi:hypothetical protein
MEGQTLDIFPAKKAQDVHWQLVLREKKAENSFQGERGLSNIFFGHLKIIDAKVGGQWPPFPPENIFCFFQKSNIIVHTIGHV